MLEKACIYKDERRPGISVVRGYTVQESTNISIANVHVVPKHPRSGSAVASNFPVVYSCMKMDTRDHQLDGQGLPQEWRGWKLSEKSGSSNRYFLVLI